MNYHADMHTGINDIEDNDFNEMEDISDGSSTEYTFTSANRNKKKIMDEVKLADKGYLKFKIPVQVNGRIKNVKIELYRTSCSPGTQIRNAVSGLHDNMRVGKLDEDLYFKVNLAQGKAYPEVTHLYYESPEQYERHFYTTVPKLEKDKWLAKYLREKNRQENSRKRREVEDMQTDVR